MQKTIKYKSTASIADLRAHLSAHLRVVRAGGEVLVTDRGRPVARLVPVEDTYADAGRMQDLSAAGLIRPPRSTVAEGFLAADRPQDPHGRGVAIMLEERAEGR